MNNLGVSPSRVEILTDSVAQVPKNQVEELGVHVIPSMLLLEGEKYRDGIDLPSQVLYQRMREEELIVQTTSPSAGQFYEVFEARLRAGVDALLYIGLSSHLSATFSAAEAGANLALEEFPGKRIALFDSKIATIAQGFIVIEAARLAAQGASLEQIIAHCEEVRRRVGLVATLETLKYLARGGRIGRATFMLGSLIQVKPVITIDGDGLVHPLFRVRRRKEALKKMIDYVEEKVDGCHTLHLAIMEADAHEQANKLRDLVQERLRPDGIIWTDFSPVMVAHSGPGIYGLAYFYD